MPLERLEILHTHIVWYNDGKKSQRQKIGPPGEPGGHLLFTIVTIILNECAKYTHTLVTHQSTIIQHIGPCGQGKLTVCCSGGLLRHNMLTSMHYRWCSVVNLRGVVCDGVVDGCGFVWHLSFHRVPCCITLPTRSVYHLLNHYLVLALRDEVSRHRNLENMLWSFSYLIGKKWLNYWPLTKISTD